MTAVVVKDKMEEWLDPVDDDTPHSQVRDHCFVNQQTNTSSNRQILMI
jgi:hypothetical protein